jgi:transposase
MPASVSSRKERISRKRLRQRAAKGHSKLDAIRALKRYIAREVFTLVAQRQKEINQARTAA